MRLTPVLALAAATLALSACSARPAAPIETPVETSAPTVSAECTTSVESLAAVEPGDFEAEDAAIVDSMNACSTVSEYTLAVEANPGAWLWTGPEFVDPYVFLLGGCTIDITTAVCTDATELGLIDSDGVPTFDAGA